MFDTKLNLEVRVVEINSETFLVAIVDADENVIEYSIFSNNDDAETAAQLIKDIFQNLFLPSKSNFTFSALIDSFK